MEKLSLSPIGHAYEAPKVEILAIEIPDVLCSSGDAATNTGGGTINMNVSSGYGW